jgi:hypothetical protein
MKTQQMSTTFYKRTDLNSLRKCSDFKAFKLAKTSNFFLNFACVGVCKEHFSHMSIFTN